jgi:CRISPR type III-A-associated RAMP protein Csm4
MNPALLIRLRPVTPWRIGPDHGTLEHSEAILHSDALYSALTLAFDQLGWMEEWLNGTAQPFAEPAVKLTSCFPYQRGLLYVAPPESLWPPPEMPGAPSKLRLKSVRLVPASVVAALARGEAFDEKAWMVDVHSGCLIPAGGKLATGPFRPMRRSAAAVDRVTGSAVEPWTAGCLQFAPASGLWCAAEFASQTAYAIWAPKLQAAFRLLADSGLGALRSRGFGRSRTPEFQAGVLGEMLLGESATATIGDEGASRTWWLLSLFSPGESDKVDWSAGTYSLVERSGRAASRAMAGQLKKTTRLVREGSLVVAAGPLAGGIRDVAPEGAPHPVWRAGYAVALELRAKSPAGGNAA